MKYIFSLIFIALAITVSAQQEAKIEVSYTEYQPNIPANFFKGICKKKISR